jgi:hypothetical protein
MKCVYSAQVWKEVEIIASLKDVWRGITIEESLKHYCNNVVVKRFEVLQLIIAWAYDSQ